MPSAVDQTIFNLKLFLFAVLGLSAIFSIWEISEELIRLQTNLKNVEQDYYDANDGFKKEINRLSLKVDRLTAHKAQAAYVTPVKYQAKRATCWSFTTLSVLEQTYRRTAITNGWMGEIEYLALSEQAYGVALFKYCKTHPQHCPTASKNSTDGGYISWLYYFKSLTNAVAPDSVCQYQQFDVSNEPKCDKYEEYMKVNPLSFEVKGYRTMYDIAMVKEALRLNKNVMPMVTALTTVSYYAPCEGPFERTLACTKQDCTLCPLDMNSKTRCCVKESRNGWSLEGEFYMHRDMETTGTHAMTIVGYNDRYKAQDGSMGGFIVKNSWGAWHSHTMQHFMQEISSVNEEQICPNSRSPKNWVVGYTKLTCADTNFCDEGIMYSVTKKVSGPDDTVSFCFKRQPIDPESQEIRTEECSPVMPLDLFGDYFQPIADQLKPNDEDSCGFFFFPYSVADEIKRRFGVFWAYDYDISWADSSFAANKGIYKGNDYTEVEASTKKIYIEQYEDALPIFPIEESEKALTGIETRRIRNSVNTISLDPERTQDDAK